MNMSTRFTVALHILTLLAADPAEAKTSEFIAGSVNTNPVVVRRLMASLRKAGMVTSQPGAGGGWVLAVDPKRLNLRDVRRVLEEGSPFSMHTQWPNQKCPVGRCIQSVLAPIYDQAEAKMEAHLARTTIQGLLESVLEKR